MKDGIKRALTNNSKTMKLLLFANQIFNFVIIYLRYIISLPMMIFPVKSNKIVICNYYGKGYGDNGKYIVEEIISRKLNYEIVWLIDKECHDRCVLPKNVRSVKYGSIKALYELSTSKFWIDNCRKEFHPIKKNRQKYIQTWHGGISLKKIEKDVEKSLSNFYVYTAKKDSKMADLFVSNSKFCTKMYRSAFQYDGRVLEIGSPRCDILFNNNNLYKSKIKHYFGIEDDSKILLYAPTFRKSHGIDVYNINFEDLLHTIERKFPNNWSIIIRLHPNIYKMSKYLNYPDYIIDASAYDDMYELLAASDVLITDYSSSMFEFSLMKKPVFLYCTDIDEYKIDRGFYFDIFDLPYPVAESNKELLEIIKEFDENVYRLKLDSFMKEINIFEDGKASKKLVNEIISF